MRLTDYIGDDHIVINDVKTPVDLSFDNVLRNYELAQDKEVDDLTMIEIMFSNFIPECELDLNLQEKSDVIDVIFNEMVAKDDLKEKKLEDEENDSEEDDEQEENKKTHDFVKDAELIYASFLYDFKIDLFTVQGKLHWKKFIALLNNLSDESPFKKVVHIRLKKIPKQTKHNKDEIKNLRKLKRFYALEDEKTPQQRIDGALDTLSHAFMGSNRAGDK